MCDVLQITHQNMASSADRSENEFTPFDDVDLLEAEAVSTADKVSCASNACDVPNDGPCIPKADNSEPGFEQSKINTDVMSASLGTDQLEDSEDISMASLSLSTEVNECRDAIAGEQNTTVTAGCVSESVCHSTSLSHEVVNIRCQTLLSRPSDGSPSMSTAVLTLDSDVDSPQRLKPGCDVTSDDGAEVDVAALQRLIVHLTAERDEYQSLYSQSKEENENYQEQILEV